MQAGKPPGARAVAVLLLGAWLSAQAASAAPGAEGAGEAAEERWYRLELDGRSAGWARERWWQEGGRIVTEAETSLRLARGTAGLEISLAGRFVETAAGEPVSLWVRRALGSGPVETTYRFFPDRVEAETVQAGRERREVLALPEGDWLTPAEARLRVRRHHRAGDRLYRLRTVDPTEGPEPVTVTRTRLGEAALPEAAGRWREELSSAPGMASVVELDAAGEVVRSTTEILGLEATLRRSDRSAALASLPAGAGPEVLLPTLVRPDRAIPRPEQTARAVYELTLAGGGALPDLPEGAGQSVERRRDRLRVTVTVTVPDAEELAAAGGRAGDRLPPPDQDGAEDLAPYLAASAYLDHGDPEIRRLLAAALPADRDPPAAELAALLTDLVRAHVAAKDLDTGFATASEVARSRSGDCTEHSVLLAALLRAAGIPARLVTGLVYLAEFAGAEGVFGYHMWVQAWTSGRWLDLDATLPGGFDATHVALAVSDLAGPEPGGELDRLLPLVGKLRIEVIEVEP
ncbi:MAG TPA: transglutaminase domain-containing protein [Thermoanaerobaculia bacterium]|nr:transglutaminase domain-containing protein [Thermoanaerobaculia bacterium]